MIIQNRCTIVYIWYGCTGMVATEWATGAYVSRWGSVDRGEEPRLPVTGRKRTDERSTRRGDFQLYDHPWWYRPRVADTTITRVGTARVTWRRTGIRRRGSSLQTAS